MHPILFHLGPVTLYTYGALLALGALAGLWLTGRYAKKDGLDVEKVQSLLVWSVLAGLIGARLAYVFIEWPAFAKDPVRIFTLWDGGLVFYGGLIGGFVVGYIFIRRYKIAPLRLLDCAAPGLALGQLFGRLGCFAAGCCYGDPYGGWCSVIFTDPHTLAPKGVYLHPTQLYTAAALLLILAVLIFLWTRRRFVGQIFLSYGLMHGIARVIIEQFRGDWRGAPLADGVTPTMVFAMVLALVCGLALIIKSRAANNERTGPR